MDPIVELVQQLKPETAPPSEGIKAHQREALFRSIAGADRTRTRLAPRRPAGHPRRVLAIVGAVAAAIVATILIAGLSSPTRPPAATSLVLTAVRRALVNTGHDIEEVHSTVSFVVQLSATSWVDVATGACRTDTAVNRKPSLTVWTEHGKATIINHTAREWWTRPATGVACEPLTPKTIAHDLRTDHYTVAGHVTLDGQASVKLKTTTTTTGLHPVTKLSTLWVNAVTYLPIRSTSSGHLTDQTTFTWLPATAANRAMLKITIPAGFHKVATPPTTTPSAP
ncbi:MAG TPA: hypothetical protein VFN87_22810 [Solirubrobacteraceae bacterium]|nr:hypothetical protein [Solirubrobacteraceae bacterium]